VWEALRSLPGLRPGKGGAREAPPVRPVPDAYVNAVKPHVSGQVWALIQLQLLTGARAGELVAMRPFDIETSHDVWTYTPAHHKTAHHGHTRTINIGRAPKRSSGRTSPAGRLTTSCSPRRRRRQDGCPTDTPRGRHRRRAGTCRRATAELFPRSSRASAMTWRATAVPSLVLATVHSRPPEPIARRQDETGEQWKRRLTPAERADLDRWRRDHRWHPHQLRHCAGTMIRRAFGLEYSQVVLGHRSMDTTAVYAEADQTKAQDVIRWSG
jgi:integrase